jgi:hypothetical protein
MKKYLFLTLIVLFTCNTYADSDYLNCDFSRYSKDWKNKKEQSIDKKFFIIAIDDDALYLPLLKEGKEKNFVLERGVYEIKEGDLVKRPVEDAIKYEYVTFRSPAESWNFMDMHIWRNTLEIKNSEGKIFGKCSVTSKNERTKNNIF